MKAVAPAAGSLVWLGFALVVPQGLRVAVLAVLDVELAATFLLGP